MYVTELSKFPGDRFMEIHRVSYGKKNQPQHLREYKLESGSGQPVGSLDEWIDYAKRLGSLDGIIVFDDIEFEAVVMDLEKVKLGKILYGDLMANIKETITL